MQSSKKLLALNLTSIARTWTRNNVSVASIIEEHSDAKLKSWDEIPGPPSYPIIGQILSFLPGRPLSDFTTIQDKLYEFYGPIVRIDGLLGRKSMVSLYDPEAIAFVLRSENLNPIRPGFETLEYYRKVHNKSAVGTRTPTGLLTDHDDNWRHFRTTVNPVLLQPKTIKLYKSAVDEVSDDMIKRMRSIRNEKNMLNGNFDTEMNLWSLESIGVIALGSRLNCFNSELPENSPEKRLIKCVHDIFKTQNELDFGLSFWRYFSTPGFKKAMELYEEQEVLARHFVIKAREELIKNKKPDDEKGVLEKLLDIDERIAIIMASDMLFAGVDTTATTMTATLYLLATNQEKQDKLREEINLDDGARRYLRACLKESIRMMPIVSGNLRQSTKEYNLHGYKIPKGTFIIFTHQLLSKMDDQFPRPKEYIPERWIESGPLSYKSAHPFSYNPFGFGVRSCIGRRIAELELESFLAKIIQNFKVEWFGPPPKVVTQSLNYIKGPFNFVFKDL